MVRMLVTAPVCNCTILAAYQTSNSAETFRSQSTQVPSSVAVTAFVESGKKRDSVSLPIVCEKL